MSQPSVSIIVPTFREAPNLEPLIRRVFSALERAQITGEMIIADDNSQDGTLEVIETQQQLYPVKLIIRDHERGLSGAVVEGLNHARYDRLVVMDADLQHPPEMIPEILTRMDRLGCDFVLGTRYGRGGSIVENWSIWRKFASRFATMLARPLTTMSDPMSGFFALPRCTWERARPLVDPIGYKIGLEIFVKGRCHHHDEVPIRFEVRREGESKFSLAQQIRYGRHLMKLYRFRFPGLFYVVSTIIFAGMVTVVYLFTKSNSVASH